ncbi:phosphoglycerate kinase [Candidatus Peregrinibacteria bacterium]|nr:phosphoglycerate kinase [Candidatus Peregrinibacteria bacterium]
MASYHLLSDIDFSGKRVLMRVDHNVDVDEDGKLKSDEKIRATLPTIELLLKQKAKLILMTHVGRPKGKVDPRYSTAGVAAHLRTLLPNTGVKHITSTVGPEAEKAAIELEGGHILYLENVRFSPDEEGEPEQQKVLGQKLAALAEVFVNEAFASCHEYEEASTCAVARLLPAYAGINLQKEIMMLSPVLHDPPRPLTLIISGAKMETKIPVIEHFLGKGDFILLGGAIANTFLAAKTGSIGRSKFEADRMDEAKKIMERSGKNGAAVLAIPTDCVVASQASETAQKSTVSADSVPKDMSIFDVGSATIDHYISVIEQSRMIVWNGPMGLYEMENFAEGTKRIAEAVAAATKNGAVTIVGGGDTIDFHARHNLPLSAYTFVSTGGGAMLEFISGKPMPALEVLR